MTPRQHLKLATDLSLPLETVTQTIAVLAKRRAGKSYTMRRLIEQLLHARQQVVLVDPKGDQWGLRSSADGKAPGLSIVILGGERGDVPLEASAGEIVAKLVVEERVSVLLDLSLFRKHEVATFMTAFLEHLYRLKAKEVYRTPVMLVIDEADAVAPQKPQKGEERMLGAAEDIVRRGGQRGIGCVLVTQRSAVLNKNVLTQAQVLIVLRTIAPQDLAAMDAWIDVHGEPAQRKTLMESLPALPVGDAWVWSPGWPTVDGIFKRVHILPIETFDSGKSPEPGAKPIEPKQAADVDLEALKRQMAATIEKAKADDPRELRKQIATLKSEVDNWRKRFEKWDTAPERKAERTPILTDADRALLDRVATALVDRAAQAHETISVADAALERQVQQAAAEYLNTVRKVGMDAALHVQQALDRVGFQKILAKLASMPAAPHTPPATHAAPRSSQADRVAPPQSQATSRRPIRLVSDRSSDEGMLSKGERTVLTVLAQRADPLPRQTITALTGYKRSTRDLYLQQLARRGFTADFSGRVAITNEGRLALGSYDPLPTGRALADHWLQRLPEGERRVLACLLDAKGAVDRDAISEATSYKRSTRDLYIQQLSRRQIVHADRAGVRASAELFD